MNEVELVTLRDSANLGLSNFIMEVDSWYAIRWAPGVAPPPWRLEDVVEIVFELASRFDACFAYVLRNANGTADLMAKAGIGLLSFCFFFFFGSGGGALSFLDDFSFVALQCVSYSSCV